MIFITGGLGGGTGTGCMPEVASIAKKMGILTVAVVTLPFEMEGVLRHENAMLGLEELEGLVDTLILIPNDKLIELAPDLPLHTAFKVADEILTNAVKGIAELITKPGLINLDFADIKAVMSSGGIAMIGLGESDTENRAVESVEKALNNPLLDVEVSGATGALINVIGGPDMTLDEAKKVVESVTERLDENAKIIWGAQLSPELQSSVRTMLVVVGVKSPQIFGPKRTMSNKKQEDMEGNFGIKFID
jgi:cell division protein FtsZ